MKLATLPQNVSRIQPSSSKPVSVGTTCRPMGSIGATQNRAHAPANFDAVVGVLSCSPLGRSRSPPANGRACGVGLAVILSDRDDFTVRTPRNCLQFPRSP